MRSEERMMENVRALDVILTPDEMKKIDELSLKA